MREKRWQVGRTGDTVLAVVEESNHAVGVHRFSGVLGCVTNQCYITRGGGTHEFVVLEVSEDLLHEWRSVLFEGSNTVRVGFLEMLLHSFHIILWCNLS